MHSLFLGGRFMKFNDEKNIISMIQNSLINYEKYLLDRKFLYVYYNTISSAFEYTELIFKKEHYKHLCGISSEPEDINKYTDLDIYKEIVHALE